MALVSTCCNSYNNCPISGSHRTDSNRVFPTMLCGSEPILLPPGSSTSTQLAPTVEVSPLEPLTSWILTLHCDHVLELRGQLALASLIYSYVSIKGKARDWGDGFKSALSSTCSPLSWIIRSKPSAFKELVPYSLYFLPALGKDSRKMYPAIRSWRTLQIP
ncbi:hypothetical protein NL676_011847 [Syzygium grande]|nr:hypothetical protein NL676_011847 [Syzygium grande]